MTTPVDTEEEASHVDTPARTEGEETAAQAAITEILNTEVRTITDSHLGTTGTAWSLAEIPEAMRLDPVIEMTPGANGEMSGETIFEREEKNLEEKDETTFGKTEETTSAAKEEKAHVRNGEKISVQIGERRFGPRESKIVEKSGEKSFRIEKNGVWLSTNEPSFLKNPTAQIPGSRFSRSEMQAWLRG